MTVIDFSIFDQSPAVPASVLAGSRGLEDGKELFLVLAAAGGVQERLHQIVGRAGRRSEEIREMQLSRHVPARAVNRWESHCPK